MANSQYCRKCDTRKMNRSPRGDSVKRDGQGNIIVEYLGYSCRKCGALWKQKIMYTAENARKKITWHKIST